MSTRRDKTWGAAARRQRQEQFSKRVPGSGRGRRLKEVWAKKVRMGDGFVCMDCQYKWEAGILTGPDVYPPQHPLPAQGEELICPKCKSGNIREIPL